MADDNTERVIITGGTGLIGRALADDLARAGRDVRVLSRDPVRGGAWPRPGVLVHGWDGRTAEGWAELADGAAAVVNLAGASIAGGRWTAERKARIRGSRVDAARAVVAAVESCRKPPRVVIQASAVGLYGPRGSEPIGEQEPPGDDFLARLVVEHEGIVARVRENGVRLAAARTGVVLASHGGALPLMALPFRLFVGGPVGSGRQYVSWIHLADEVAALRWLIEDERAEGAFNLTAPSPVTNAEFGRALGRVLRRPSWLPAPGWALRAVMGEMSTVVLSGARVLPRRLTAMGFGFRFPDVDAALRDVLLPTPGG